MIRILVVEDQALVLGAIASLLALESDFSVMGTACDGRAALEIIDGDRPDLVISDIEMTGMSGIDLAGHLKRSAPEVCVVIVTTFARPGYLSRALAAGVRGYLLKDTPSRELARIVRRVMAGERIVDAQLRDLPQNGADDPLNDRDRELLRLVEEGHSNKTIAVMLNKAPGTIRNHFSEILQKLNAVNRIDACRIARQMGWL